MQDLSGACFYANKHAIFLVSLAIIKSYLFLSGNRIVPRWSFCFSCIKPSVWWFRCVSIIQHRPTETSPKRAAALTRTECLSNYTLHTLTRASVRLVHMAISSRTAISGYRFLENIASSSWSWYEVKCVRCLRCFRFCFNPSPSMEALSAGQNVNNIYRMISTFREE